MLFGFQLNGVFQEAFPDLAESTRLLTCFGQFLMVLSIALLIAPSMQHRIIEGGEDSNRIHRATTLYAGWALLPFEISLGLGAYVVFDHLYGRMAALFIGTTFCLLAGFFWFGFEAIVKLSTGNKRMREAEKPTPLPAKIDQMLTEARVILPGAQALLGFQLTVTLTRAFEQLPEHVKLLHAAALCCVGFAVILLIRRRHFTESPSLEKTRRTSCALGRLSSLPRRLFSPLALPVTSLLRRFRRRDRKIISLAVASASMILLMLFWFVVPLYIRRYRVSGG